MAAEAARQQAAAAVREAHLTGPVPAPSGTPLPDPARVAELQRSLAERQREQAAARGLAQARPPETGGASTAGTTDAATATASPTGVASSYPPDAPGTPERAGRTDAPPVDGAQASPGASGFLAAMTNALGGLGPSGYVRLGVAVAVLVLIAGFAALAWRIAYSPKPGRKNGHAKKPTGTA
jgi:hypothetical protein